MAGYGLKDINQQLRELRGRKYEPRANCCGACGEECQSLICDECAEEIATELGNPEPLHV